MVWTFTFSCIVTDPPPADDAIERHFDLVLDELEKLGVEADITASLASGRVDFDVEIDTPLIQDALAEGLTALRTALHAAGASTPNWPNVDDVEPAEDGHGQWVARLAAAETRMVGMDLQDA